MSLFQSFTGFLSSAIGSTEQLVSQHTGFSSGSNKSNANTDGFDYSPLTFFKDQNSSSQKLENTHSESKFFSGTQVISSPFQTLKEASSLLPSKFTPVVEVFQTAISSAQSTINSNASSSLTSSPANSSNKFTTRREEATKYNSFAQFPQTIETPQSNAQPLQSSPAMGMEVDLSHLSEEERLQIEAVMARAMGDAAPPPIQDNPEVYLPHSNNNDSVLGQFDSYRSYDRPLDTGLYQHDFVRDQEHLNSYTSNGPESRDDDFRTYDSGGFNHYDDYLNSMDYGSISHSINKTHHSEMQSVSNVSEYAMSDMRMKEKDNEMAEVRISAGERSSPDEEVEHFECVICNMMKIKDQDDAICSDCRRANICFECGTSDNQEGVWLCNVCRKRRDLMDATTKWRLQQQEGDENTASVFASRSTSAHPSAYQQAIFEQSAGVNTLQQQHSLPSGVHRHAELQRQTSLNINNSYPNVSSTSQSSSSSTPSTSSTTNYTPDGNMKNNSSISYETSFDQYYSTDEKAQSDNYILNPLQPASYESSSTDSYSNIYSESKPAQSFRDHFDFIDKTQDRRLSDPTMYQPHHDGQSQNIPTSFQTFSNQEAFSNDLKTFRTEDAARTFDKATFSEAETPGTTKIEQQQQSIFSSSSSVASVTSQQPSMFPGIRDDHGFGQKSIGSTPHQAISSAHFDTDRSHDYSVISPAVTAPSTCVYSKSTGEAEVSNAKGARVPPIEKVGYVDPELIQSPKRSPKSLATNFTSSNMPWTRHRDNSPLYRDVGQYRAPMFNNNNNLPSNDKAPLQMLVKTSTTPWTNTFNNNSSNNNNLGGMAGACDYEICVDSYSNLSGDYFSGLMEAPTKGHFIFDATPPVSSDDAKIFIPPQKPARFTSNNLSSQRFENNEGDTLASFAASVASDTALLTNTMSVSPMVEIKRGPEIIGPTSQLFADFPRKNDDFTMNAQPFRNFQTDPSSTENRFPSQSSHSMTIITATTNYFDVQSKSITAGKSIFSSNHKPISRHSGIPSPVVTQGRIQQVTSLSEQERLKQSIMKRAPRYENLSKITADSSSIVQLKTTDVVVGSSGLEHSRRTGVCRPPEVTASLIDLTKSGIVSSTISQARSGILEITKHPISSTLFDEQTNANIKASISNSEPNATNSSIVMMTPITSVNIFLSNFMKEDSDKEKQSISMQQAISLPSESIQKQSNEPIDLSMCSNTSTSKSSTFEHNSRQGNSLAADKTYELENIQSTFKVSTPCKDVFPKNDYDKNINTPNRLSFESNENANQHAGMMNKSVKPSSSIAAQSSPEHSSSHFGVKKLQKRLPATPMETKSNEPSHVAQVTFEGEKNEKENRFKMLDTNLLGQTDLSDIDSKKTLSMVLMSMSNQASSMSKHDKMHRKLPPTPNQLPVSKTKLRSRSADSRKYNEDSAEVVKERLRRHLRSKEIHKRGGSSSEKSEDEDDSSDASNASSRFFTTGSSSFRQRSTSFGANFGATRDRSSPKTSSTARAKSVGRQSRFDVFVNSKTANISDKFSSRAETESQNKYMQNSISKYKTPKSITSSMVNVNNFSKYNKPHVEMVAFHGIQVPIEIKSLKQRIREELQIVTASRRLRLDEEEEVRRMEAEMAERERRRLDWKPAYDKRYRSNSPVIHISKDSYNHDIIKSAMNKNDILNKYHKKHQSQVGKKSLIPNRRTNRHEETPGKHKNYLSSYTGKSHLQTKPSFKRQNSDPLISNFIPMTDTMSSDKTSYSERPRGRNYAEYDGMDRKLNDRHYFGDSQRITGRKYMSKNATSRAGYTMDAMPQGYGSLSRSSDLLFKHVKPRLANSHSEANLLMDGWNEESELEGRDTFQRRFLRTPSFSHAEENENPLLREEKKEQLRLEIELRKLQLEEARYLQEQIQKLMAMPDVTSTDISKARSLYQKRRRLDSQMFPFRSFEPSLASRANADSHRYKSFADINKPSPFSSLAISPRQNLSDFSKVVPSLGKENFQMNASPESVENLTEVGLNAQPSKSNGVMRKQTKQYSFPTKTILITRDLKDKYLEGFGIGVKITGGQYLDKDGQMGAFVTTIYKGGAADHLHGELREGDQVLEWNGHPLTGKTQEEIDRIMSYSNGEIELVIRANESSTPSKPSSIRSTLYTDSEMSFIGNENQSDSEEYRTFTDRDTRRQVAKPYTSPPLSPTSSQQDLFSESSVVSSANSSKSDAGSPNGYKPGAETYDYLNDMSLGQIKSDKQSKHVDGYTSRNKSGTAVGEIQLQLSYDTYDSTLNVHVIQARGLQPLNSRGHLDSFVKVQFIPLTSQSHKRCTKYISRSLNPEWHQTLVFIGIPRTEISKKGLEVSVWDFDKFKNHEYLGEVLISLSDSRCLDNRPHWYQLQKSRKKHTDEGIKFEEENEDGGNRKKGGHRRHDKDQSRGSEGGNLSRQNNPDVMKDSAHRSRSGKHAKHGNIESSESQHDTGFNGDRSQLGSEKLEKETSSKHITLNLRESLFSENSLVSLQSSIRNGKLKLDRSPAREYRNTINAQKTIFSKILSGIVSIVFKSFSCCQYNPWKDKHETIPMNRTEANGCQMASP